MTDEPVIAEASHADAERTFNTAKHDVLFVVRTISLLQAGQCLGIGRTKTYQLNREGTFPVRVRNIAGELRVRLKDLEDFLDTSE